MFEKTYNKLRLSIGVNKLLSLIILTGDILHAKTELSPESISMTYHFLKKLSELATVILIPGNHDTNLSNRHRLDALSPIVNDVGNLSNLFYLKNSGFYLFNNIIFGVTSIFDQVLLTTDKLTQDMLSHTSKHKNKYIIALYHGAVHSAQTDVGFRMNREELLVEHFDGYDFVLLGDIHKFQYLNEKKTIAYAGSLIQQSHSETLHSHGVLQWDLKSSESKLLEIKNDYGYCTVRITDGLIAPGTIICAKPRIRFILENTNEIQYAEILKKIEKEHDVCEIVKESNFRTKLRHIDKNKSTMNVTAPTSASSDPLKTQHDIIRSYLTGQKLSTDQIDSFMNLHKKIYQKILAEKKDQVISDTKVSLSKNQTWKILELKFSNTLSYGKDNIIDFRNYEPNHIIGIMAPNRYGKSAILDIILFCLFDKMSRGERRDILNKNENQMYCSLLIGIGKTQYLIERIGQRSKNGLSVKIDVNFYSIASNQKEKLNGLDKNDTNKKIIELVGDYTDYLTTCICLQNSKTNNFIDMTQLQKKEYLNEILKLNIFEDCHSVSSNKVKELTGQMKLLEKKISTTSMTDITESISTVTQEIQKLNLRQKISKELISENLDHMLDVHKQLPLNNYSELSEYKLETESDISNTIGRLEITLNEISIPDIHKINLSINSLGLELEKINITITEADSDSKLKSLRTKLEKLLIQIIHIPESDPRSKLNIKNLTKECTICEEKIIQINKTLKEKFPSEIADNADQIKHLKTKITDLTKQLTYVNQSDFDPNPHQQFINLQFDSLDLLAKYDNYYLLKSDLSAEKISCIITTGDKYKALLLKNISDISLYIQKTGSDKLLENVLDRDNKWIRNYDNWKKRVLNPSNQLNQLNPSPDKDYLILKNNIRESMSDIISVTFDMINSVDNCVINSKIQNYEKKLSKLVESVNYKKECDMLNQELKLVTQQLGCLKTSICSVSEFNTQINHNLSVQSQVDEVRGSINQVEVELNELITARNKIKQEISHQRTLIKNHSMDISKRNILSKHIRLLNEYQTMFIIHSHKFDIYNQYAKLKKESEHELYEISIQLVHKKSSLETLNKDMNIYLSSRKEFDDKSAEINLYQLYTHHMNYNGLPYEILKDYLPIIGADINQILHSMVNFEIEFMFHDESQLADQKSKQLKSTTGCININICHPNTITRKKMKPYNVQLASGFEKFIIGLAIRMTLGQISLTAKPNFLVVDEGWSCLDSEYKNDIPTIMSYIKNQYDHVIIISHLEELKHQSDYIINIDRTDGYSYVDTGRRKFIEGKSKKKKSSSKRPIVNI